MEDQMTSAIEDYALIADDRSAALIDRTGSINWMCWPAMDSRAMFCALLGNSENGYWKICPTGEFTSHRHYLGNTLILETEFQTPKGRARLVDWLTADNYQSGKEQPQILYRRVECTEGVVEFEMHFVPRYDYGSIRPWVTKAQHGIRAVAGPDCVELRATCELEIVNDSVFSRFLVARDETCDFSLIWEGFEGFEKPVEADIDKSLSQTRELWENWAARCKYDGPHKELVIRSLLTLKAMIDHNSGGMVAAITTSLPEDIGGVRNWDYRFCWIRDATYTLYTFLTAGYQEEAEAWRKWLERAAAGTPDQVNIMYGIRGERRLPELTLDWLSGYKNSKPVRTGNAAYNQRQLDIFGELMDTLHLARKSGLAPDNASWEMQKKIIGFLETEWHEPDEGIWETRSPRQNFTHSKVMAWVAFDRAIKDVEMFNQQGDVVGWRKIRKQIHDQVCEKGFNKEINSFTQAYGSKNVDASLLLMAHVGFLPANDPRFLGTVRKIEDDLIHGGFVLRYLSDDAHDGVAGREGAFLACSFWLVDTYILIGERQKAEELFLRLIALVNDVGLISEEYDYKNKHLLGNFPQALTHLSLVNSAFNLWLSHGPTHDRSQCSE
jgi:GH15 family glucan-1,4-alpha-glucosidase